MTLTRTLNSDAPLPADEDIQLVLQSIARNQHDNVHALIVLNWSMYGVQTSSFSQHNKQRRRLRQLKRERRRAHEGLLLWNLRDRLLCLEDRPVPPCGRVRVIWRVSRR